MSSSLLKIHFIQLNDEHHLGPMIYAMNESFFMLNKVEVVIFCREEIIKKFDLFKFLRIRFIALNSEDIMRAQKNLVSEDDQLWDELKVDERADILVNSTLTQAGFYFMRAMNAAIKVGPRMDHQKKLLLGDEFSQKLFLIKELEHNSCLNLSAVFSSLFEQWEKEFSGNSLLASESDVEGLKVQKQLTLITSSYISTFLTHKTESVLGLFFDTPALLSTLNPKILFFMIQHLNITQIITNEECLPLVKDLAQSQQLTVQMMTLEESCCHIDFCFTDRLGASWWTSLLVIPTVIVQSSYGYNLKMTSETTSEMTSEVDIVKQLAHCPQDYALTLLVEGQGLTQGQKEDIQQFWKEAQHLESLTEYLNHPELFKSTYLKEKKILYPHSLLPRDALFYCQELVWDFYFRHLEVPLPLFPEDLSVNYNEQMLVKKIHHRIELLLKCYQWMIHFCQKVLKQELSPKFFRKELNTLMEHQKTLCREEPILAASGHWFRAKLMNEKISDSEEQARRVILGAQEATLCLNAIAELMTKCYQPVQKLGQIRS